MRGMHLTLSLPLDRLRPAMAAPRRFVLLVATVLAICSSCRAFSPALLGSANSALAGRPSPVSEVPVRTHMGDHSAGFRRDSIARNLASDAVVGGDAGASDKGDDNVDADESIDTSMDPRLFRVRLSRAAGIEWGTDLSFSFVYIRTMEPAGAADLSGELEVGDQLCELRPVLGQGADEKAAPVPLVGAPFDMVMNAFATLSNDVREIDLVFFRGTKDELKSLASGGGGKAEADTITITVVQDKGSAQEQVRTIRAPTGCNVREVLIEEGINVYQSVTRWTNCKGKQLCGTCIVNMAAGGLDTNRKSMDEASTLRENPESYRLSCVTFAYGDVTVETFPPIKAAQWTR